jgi:hypothetical protein
VDVVFFQKTCFASLSEARVTATVQILFYVIFGRTSSSILDDSEFLLAKVDAHKWGNGSTSLHHQLGQGMSNVEYQVESAKTKHFVTEFCNFITQDYLKWHRGHT